MLRRGLLVRPCSVRINAHNFLHDLIDIRRLHVLQSRKKPLNLNPGYFGPSPDLLPEAVRLADALRSGAHDRNDPALELHLSGAGEQVERDA